MSNKKPVTKTSGTKKPVGNKSETLKSKLVNQETMSYLIFGVLTTVVDFIIYIICTSLSVNYLWANVIAWCGAVIFAYITNKLFVFKSNAKKFKELLNEFLSFVTGRVFSLIFSLVFIYMTVTLIGFAPIISKVLSAVFVVIINYVLSKLYIFPKPEEQQNTGILNWFKQNIHYIIAFLIPLGILIVVYKVREIYPFGDNMYLRSDCYHQYAPFHMEMFDKLMNGESMMYSWDIGLGINFSALYSYYLASPINWFLGLFSRNHIIEVMNVFIIVKTCLCSVTFTHYISRHFQSKKIQVAAFGVFYALSSYFAAFSWNLMWLDCLLLLPLIVLGLEALVKENKCYLYCITLAFAILSNYYIAIMICIFCVLYFFALLFADDAKKNFQYYFLKFKNFALYSFLAGCFGAVSILPALQALGATDSGEFNFPEKISNYFSLYEMLSRSMMNVEASIFSAHDPNLYCTVAVFILLPLYVINSKIHAKEKVAKVILVGIFLFSFNTNIPNYIWHGFHFPNSLPCRQSFIYIFLILTMCYEALHYIREITTKQLMSTFAGALALFFSFEHFFVSDSYNFMIIYLSVAFLIFYTFMLFMMKSGNYKQNFVVYLLFVIVIAETYINTEETALSTSTRSAYLNDNAPITELIDYAKEHDDTIFYRTEKYNRRTKNDAAWIGYHGASTFSSTASLGLSEYYGSLGFEKSTNAYAYYGHTPLTESLFSIKYVISNSKKADTDTAKLYTSSKNDDYHLYENIYTLPIGFMIPSDLEENWDLSRTNPFEVQNAFCSYVNGSAEGEDLMYTRLMVDTENQVYLEENTHYFIYVTTSLEDIKVTITNPDGSTNTKTFSSMKHRHILDLGKYDAGTIIKVESDDSEVSSLQYYAYSYDNTIFLNTYETLMEQPLNLTTFEDTYLKGSIDVTEAGLMYTSIPYDEGWTVYVDGEEVETNAFENALLSVYLSEGTHEIELKYSAPGLRLGIALTICSTIAFVLLLIIDYKKRKHSLAE